ncbi:MAG TPA: hypothetical protein VNM14_18045 [Planctomycetota bacterium]|nr:hypothetical protein [Planctomycetota bacterium]
MIKKTSERGSALLLVVVVTLIIIGISGTYMTVSFFNTRKADQDANGLRALYIAETAAAMVINMVNHPPGTPTTPGRPVAINTLQQMAGGYYLIPTYHTPIAFQGNGTPLLKTPPNNVQIFFDYKNEAAPNNDENYARFQVYGMYGGVTRKIDVLVSRVAGGAWWNAVYSPNRDNTSGYVLNFNGTGTNNDVIMGDIYSGGGFSASGTTSLLGPDGTGVSTVTYKDTFSSSISTPPNSAQGTEPALDLKKDAANFNKTPWETKAANNRTTAPTTTTNRRDPSDGFTYIDVKNDLDTKGAGGPFTWADGGTAEKQINDPTEPSHIFRKNPSSIYGSANRTNYYESAAHGKDDFYLEDPTPGIRANTNTISPAINGDTSATPITIQPNGNQAVYFIDGNMRVSGEPIKSYQLTKSGGLTDNLQMTFIVKGNVSLTDNLLYPTYQSQNDAVAIIAIADDAFPNQTAANFMSGSDPLPAISNLNTVAGFVADYNTRTQAARDAGRNVPAFPTDVSTWTGAERERAAQEYNKAYGSGNIYFGDPGSGTVEHFESFMYAENNFYATNLNSTSASGGTQKVEIFGNMTAGNQVKIVRDTVDANGNPSTYVPLKVRMDTKIMSPTGTKPPALPSPPSTAGGFWFVATSKQVP